MGPLNRASHIRDLQPFSITGYYVNGSNFRHCAGESNLLTIIVMDFIRGFTPGGGPLQMLLTLTLNLLPASPKNSATGQTFGPFRKGQKVNHLYRKFGPFEEFFA